MSLARVVSRAMERIAPTSLAESWDNVGLLLEAATPRRNAKGILLTIDLTPAVLQEALDSPGTGMIVSYHPPIFKPLTSLTLSNPLQRSLLSCASAGISIYTPHTALDNVRGGINDWLAQGVLGYSAEEARERVKMPHPGVSVLGEIKGEGAGVGRLVTLRETPAVSIGSLAARLKAFLNLSHVQVALAQDASLDAPIGTVAICAGSGGSVIGGTRADVYFTGEMQHHEVLAAAASGSHVILCGHTNTERGYLATLAESLNKQLQIQSVDDDTQNYHLVSVSRADAHPLQLV